MRPPQTRPLPALIAIGVLMAFLMIALLMIQEAGPRHPDASLSSSDLPAGTQLPLQP